MDKKNIILGITGASGALYAERLIKKLESKAEEINELAILMSENAKQVWEYELGSKPRFPDFAKVYAKNDFNAPFASGSSSFDPMILCPCSMGSLGRIASGISDDLMLRAADVILKEHRKLILVPRESPFNLIHLRNMTTISEAGGIIIPAIPSFYSKPQSIEDLADTVVDRILVHAGFGNQSYVWGAKD